MATSALMIFLFLSFLSVTSVASQIPCLVEVAPDGKCRFEIFVFCIVLCKIIHVLLFKYRIVFTQSYNNELVQVVQNEYQKLYR